VVQRLIGRGATDARSEESDPDESRRVDGHEFNVSAVGLHRRANQRQQSFDVASKRAFAEMSGCGWQG
jgi:hypothetical protein